MSEKYPRNVGVGHMSSMCSPWLRLILEVFGSHRHRQKSTVIIRQVIASFKSKIKFYVIIHKEKFTFHVTWCSYFEKHYSS